MRHGREERRLHTFSVFVGRIVRLVYQCCKAQAADEFSADIRGV